MASSPILGEVGDYMCRARWGDHMCRARWGDHICRARWGDHMFRARWGDHMCRARWGDHMCRARWGDHMCRARWGDHMCRARWGLVIYPPLRRAATYGHEFDCSVIVWLFNYCCFRTTPVHELHVSCIFILNGTSIFRFVKTFNLKCVKCTK